ncbi:TetR/AcrR family transcriptional regulator [Parasphingorhabdus sp.]|uniref:TetR/AcrR family transcriptional regulator n=1 Tax=Parasphingorhabdus sp. TaxID=2709688 RepID=UPI0030036D68
MKKIEPDLARLDRRRRAIIEAAHQLFVEQGFERTTLGHIVDRAGGSLATVYKLFGNKEGLLEAVVFEQVGSGENIIREIAAANAPPAETLRQIATELNRRFLDPDEVALVRIVIARSIEDPAFAQRFFETTAMCTREALERIFVAWSKAGIAMDGEPEMLAEIFLGLIILDLQTEAISHGTAGQPSLESLALRTEFFLKGAGLAG